MELSIQMLLPIFTKFPGGSSSFKMFWRTFFHSIAVCQAEDTSSLVATWEVYEKRLPKELSTRWSDFNQAAGQAFPFHHRGHCRQAVAFDQAAGDPRWGRALPRGDYDAQPVVPAASHGTTAGIHHETNQETESWNGRLDGVWNTGQ